MAIHESYRLVGPDTEDGAELLSPEIQQSGTLCTETIVNEI